MSQIPFHSKGQTLRERRNIRDLEQEYKNGNKKPLSDLLRAWKGIQDLDPKNENSFFVIAGYHGEPFRGAGWGNPQWWGGYCNHGNILFPTWHRAYLWRLENALRSIKGCEHVTLPYWDETDDTTKNYGVPAIFLAKNWTLDDGTPIDNPLYSYKFRAPVTDNLIQPQIVADPNEKVYIPNPDYSKPKGYKTVRYPFSGLVGPQDADSTKKHNDEMNALGETKVDQMLNDNVKGWLNQFIVLDNGQTLETGTRQKYIKCLEAPNYTVFSNTTSAQQWNEDAFQGSGLPTVVPLESPHNDIHLAVGGFEITGQGDFNTQQGANGDMGENDTASFDPIFYFHHCFIDKTFWKWQELHGATNKLSIREGYPGTSSVDNQGPTPGVAGGTWLTLDTSLDPFKIDNRPMTSRDLVNIVTQLDYTYVDYPPAGKPPLQLIPPTPVIHAKLTGVNRGSIGGSFVLATYKETSSHHSTSAPPTTQLLGFETILSRWHVSGCANCMTHLNVKSFVPLHGVTDDEIKDPNVKIYAKVVPRTNQDGKTLIGSKHVPKPSLQVGRRY